MLSETEKETRERDLDTLVRILRGPGNYPTPSPERIQRLVNSGLVVKLRGGALRPTLKGRIVGWFHKRR